MKSPILITGCARSGTSVTAGIINICGAFGGTMSGPNPNNKKGMFENINIRNNIVKPYLKSIGCDSLCQKPLPNSKQVFEVNEIYAAEWRERIVLEMQHQGYVDSPWFYKGAKMCLMWYLWHLAFPDAKWVIVRRDDNAIAHSCLKTSFMRAYRDREGWLKWVRIHKKRFAQMHVAGLDIIEVWPKKIMEGNTEEMKDMIEKLGLEWKDNLVKAFVDPSLYGGK